VKVKNISTSYTLYLQDLLLTASFEKRRGEDIYLGPGRSVYLPNTSEVVRSAYKGELRKWADHGVVELEDVVDLDASGGPDDSVTLTHDFGLPPQVFVLKQVSTTWVDATGTVDIVHDDVFSSVTVTNTTAFAMTFMIRLL
jgi:hypothetical protein